MRNRETDLGSQFAEAKLSESYTMIDALQMAAYLNAFIRHADIALISNHAQLVNVLAALLAEVGLADLHYFNRLIGFLSG